MSTAGTLYENTIQNGYAKLLSINTVSAPVASIDMSCNYAGFDSYFFDLDQLYMDSLALHMSVSSDGGATWPMSGTQWVMHTMFVQDTVNPGPYRSYANGVLGVFNRCQISHGQWPANALSGRIRLSSSDGRGNVLFKTAGVMNPYYDMLNWGGAYFDGAGLITKLRIYANGGNISGGTVRQYGFRTGA